MKITRPAWLIPLLCFIAALPAVANVPKHKLAPERVIEFEYRTEIPAVAQGEGPVDIFVPLAQSDFNQKILKREIISSQKGKEKKEGVYGNLFWHARVEHTNGKPIPVTVKYQIQREFYQVVPGEKAGPGVDAPDEELAFYLKPNNRVPVSGDLIGKVKADLPEMGKSKLDRARAIYDYVVANMEYKKVGTGWGNGDTYWACSKKYGNCTDFHALFISLARAEKIPARFEIGFPIPTDKAQGKIGGYHCWVTFHIPDKGWVPLDASEARKHPEMKELLFGSHPADRIQFTRGRDIRLGEGHTTDPLNYFIYPHVEVGGKRVDTVKTEFNYRLET